MWMNFFQHRSSLNLISLSFRFCRRPYISTMMLLVIYSAFSHSIDFGTMNKSEKEILSQKWFPWEPVSNLRYSMDSPETTKDAFLIQSIPRDAVALLAPQKLQRYWEIDTRSQRSKVKGRRKAFPVPLSTRSSLCQESGLGSWICISHYNTLIIAGSYNSTHMTYHV